jgi:predicted SAM-dependent methyltransferase
VLEHLSIAEALPVFHELYRMLVPGGKLYVSVPDLETMCWMFTSPTYNVADKFSLMKVIYGGQTDAHDFHHIGYTFDFLVDMLRDAGFQSMEHVESLGLFEDTSELVFLGQRVSLNLIVSK